MVESPTRKDIIQAILSNPKLNDEEKAVIQFVIHPKSKKIEIISMAPTISEAMKRIANSTSVSSLFK